MGQGSEAMFVVLLILSIACVLAWPPLAAIAVIGIGLYLFLPDDCMEPIFTANITPPPASSTAAVVAAASENQEMLPMFGTLDAFVSRMEQTKALVDDGTFNHDHNRRRRKMIEDNLHRATTTISVDSYRDAMDAYGELQARRAEITNPDPDDLILDPDVLAARNIYQEMQAETSASAFVMGISDNDDTFFT
jgi:hypothetical protein